MENPTKEKFFSPTTALLQKSENNESTIPTVLRDRIQEELESLL